MLCTSVFGTISKHISNAIYLRPTITGSYAWLNGDWLKNYRMNWFDRGSIYHQSAKNTSAAKIACELPLCCMNNFRRP
jgi:hypothetical protein